MNPPGTPARSTQSFFSHWKLSAWPLFLLFGISNCILSYMPLDPWSKVAVLLAGLVAPFGLALKSSLTGAPPLSGDRDPFPVFSLGAILLVLAAGAFIRFYRLERLSGWPLLDEGLIGFLAMDQSEKWRWDLFGGMTQIPCLFYWLLGLFFKVLGPSLRSLWLFPALLSFLTLPLVHSAAGIFGLRSRAWTATALFALSFWPFYLGRFCVPPVLLASWEILVLLLLGLFLRSAPARPPRSTTLLLGSATGLGFYIHFHWAVMALAVVLAVGWETMARKPRPWGSMLLFLAPVCGLALPLVVVGWHEKSGGYLSMLWTLKEGMDWKTQGKACWDYLSALFWGVQTPRFTYKPFWGGFFNPLLDSALELGGLALCRQRLSRRNLWIAAALFLFILPAWLTQELEMFRMVLLLPILLFLALEGLEELLRGTPVPRRGWILALFLLASAGLDFYHLLGPYQRACHSDYSTLAEYTKPFEYWKAYQLLEKRSVDQGPGLILAEMESSPFNQTLAISVYPFNASRNPRLDPEKARWMAFLTNINYAPFLAKSYPWIEWVELSPGHPLPQVTVVLGLFSLENPSARALAQRWLGAERSFRPLTSELLWGAFAQDRGPVLEGLARLEPVTQGDPFLESCRGEKIFFNAMACNRPMAALSALQRAILKGYPSANLFNDLGVVWWNLGDKAKARQAFQAAVRSPLNHTTAAENLWAID